MRPVLRFAVVLIVGLGLVAALASIVFNKTARSWFESDLRLRAEIAVRGARQELVLPGHVGDPAVAAFGRCPQRAGQPPGPAACVDDQVGVDLPVAYPHPGGPSPLAADLISMAGAQRYSRLRLGG